MTEVPFARGADLPDQDQLASAYLQVLAAATGRPILRGEPQSTVERDWSDYDYPSEQSYQLWGKEDYGLKLLTSTRFVHHGRPAGWVGFWIFMGVEGLSGQSKLHALWKSYAGLETKEESLGQLFVEQLRPWDLRRQPEGQARADLEDLLTQHCWYGSALEGLPQPDLAGATVGSEVWNSGQFLAAVCAAAGGRPEAALQRLEAVGEDWAYGLACRYEEGKPAGLVWQDDFPRPCPRLQVILLKYALTGCDTELEEIKTGPCDLARQGLKSLGSAA